MLELLVSDWTKNVRIVTERLEKNLKVYFV
jgi:hypothetical protein